MGRGGVRLRASPFPSHLSLLDTAAHSQVRFSLFSEPILETYLNLVGTYNLSRWQSESAMALAIMLEEFAPPHSYIRAQARILSSCVEEAGTRKRKEDLSSIPTLHFDLVCLLLLQKTSIFLSFIIDLLSSYILFICIIYLLSTYFSLFSTVKVDHDQNQLDGFFGLHIMITVCH